jgi:L-threonylcarbamoyladenylate synthase
VLPYSDNPLIVHVASMDQCYSLVTGGAKGVNAIAHKLMAAFWPGPLTFILPTQPGVLVSRRVTGLSAAATVGSVGVRMPSHPVALALIRRSNVPIAAPSANRSGKPSPTSAQHVLQDLGGRISGVVDGGDTCQVGVESTVIDCTGRYWLGALKNDGRGERGINWRGRLV